MVSLITRERTIKEKLINMICKKKLIFRGKRKRKIRLVKENGNGCSHGGEARGRGRKGGEAGRYGGEQKMEEKGKKVRKRN